MANVPPEIESLVREASAAWNEGGLTAWEPYVADGFELESPEEVPGGGTFRGRARAFEFLRSWTQGGGGVRIQWSLNEILPAGDEYLCVFDATGVGDTSGIELPAQEWFHLIRVENGKLVRDRVFLDREAAFRAAGLRPGPG